MKYANAFVRPTDGLGGASAKKSKYRPHITPHAYGTKVDDDTAKSIIREWLLGGTHNKIAQKYNVRVGYVRDLVNGVNRAHLLVEVQKETGKFNK